VVLEKEVYGCHIYCSTNNGKEKRIQSITFLLSMGFEKAYDNLNHIIL